MAFNPFRHLGLKLVSVAVAVLLWFAVSGQQLVERSLLVPLELQNKPERLELTGLPPTNVDVRVRGASSTLGRLGSGDVLAVVDLSAARPGRQFFHLAPDQIRTPFGVEVAQVSPWTLVLDFEPSETRVIPVRASLEGRPAEGSVVERVTVEPAAVQVVGPETPVRELREAVTEAISVAGLSRSFKATATIALQAPSVRLKSARSVLVAVTIGPGAAFEVVAVEPILAFVDLVGLAAGRYPLRVRVEPAPNLEILRIDPAVVRVTLR
jgi:hypothetical protein